MQAILLFSNDKSKQLFRSDMYSFPSLFNVFLSFFLFLSLPFFSLLRFTFSFLLSPFSSVLFSIPFLFFLFFLEYLSLSFFYFLPSSPAIFLLIIP